MAMSVDGYIAGPNGEADWIVMDPDIDFSEIFARFDTLLIGRKSYVAMQAMADEAGEFDMAPGVRSVVVSRTMAQDAHPDLTIVSDVQPFVADLKTKQAKIFGCGEAVSCFAAFWKPASSMASTSRWFR